MDAAKALISLLVVFLAANAAAISFQAEVEPNATFTVKNVQFQQNVSNLQTANFSVINTGSVGCTVRLHAVFNDSGQAYSRSAPLWPGSSVLLEANRFFDKAGSYQGILRLEYCGKKDRVDSFNFTVSESRNSTLREINSTTTEVGQDSLEIELAAEEGLLLPRESPPYWKVADAAAVNGTASIDYDAPIFDSEEKLRFAVYNQSTETLEGYTVVGLEEPEPGVWERRISWLKKNSVQIIAVSIVLNLILAALLLRSRKAKASES